MRGGCGGGGGALQVELVVKRIPQLQRIQEVQREVRQTQPLCAQDMVPEFAGELRPPVESASAVQLTNLACLQLAAAAGLHNQSSHQRALHLNRPQVYVQVARQAELLPTYIRPTAIIHVLTKALGAMVDCRKLMEANVSVQKRLVKIAEELEVRNRPSQAEPPSRVGAAW